MVMVDGYYKYPVVELTESTAISKVGPLLDKIFATFGLPEKICTDNGSPFQGGEFIYFLEHHGI